MSFLRYAPLFALVACGHGGNSTTGTGGPTPTYTVEKLQDPETCRDCHPKQYAEWSGSMHAYASDDPLFVALNKKGQDAKIGSFCVKCHAPMAVHAGYYDGRLDPGTLPKKLHGVTCYFCHNVDAVLDTHDNPLHLADDVAMRGEYADTVTNKAHHSLYSTFVDRDNTDSAKMCGSCHDIVNRNAAHIERTYAEWQESVFSTLGGNTCSQCHMAQSAVEPIAEGPDVTGVFGRRRHDHQFPAVDLALIDWPQADAQRASVQALLDTELQSSLCVRGFENMPGASIMIVVDNVAGGHHWPSGAAQDRRFWFEVIAYKNGSPIYQSGVVPQGSAPTELTSDADLWLLRDCMFDSSGKETHNFWDAASFETNALPAQLTFVQSDPRYYQSHIFQNYPRAVDKKLPDYPDRVTLRALLQPFPLDLFDELFPSQQGQDAGLTPEQVAAMRAKLAAPLIVGKTVEWTLAAAGDPAHGGESYTDMHIPVNCVSNTALKASFDKVLATNHKMCAP
jgi:hypothetical protein